MPAWLLFGIPLVWAVSLASSIALGQVGPLAGVALLGSMFAAFVVVPVTLYALVTRPELRSAWQWIGVASCSVPILALGAAFLAGGA